MSQLDNDNVKRGLDIDKISTNIKLDNDIKCSICFDEFKKDEIIKKLNCEHLLCTECTKEWFSENVKCPICMKELG